MFCLGIFDILPALKEQRFWVQTTDAGYARLTLSHPTDNALPVCTIVSKSRPQRTWFDEPSGNYVVDNRRTKTNRRLMVREAYKRTDFDFALVYIEQLDLFYVFPIDVFIGYGSEIHLVETEKRQRKPLSVQYRNAWNLILQASVSKENSVPALV